MLDVWSAFPIHHGVIDEGVVAGLRQHELDEAALCRRQVQHLRPAMLRVARLQEVGALLEHRVELGPDHVEGRPTLRSGVHDPHPDPFPDPDPDRRVVVLVGVAVEQDRVGFLGSDLGLVRDAVLRTEVELRAHQHQLRVDRREAGRVDDHCAVHAVRDVQGDRHRAAVVEPRPGAVRDELVGQRLPRCDGAHRLVRREGPGVEVDAVPHARVVDEGDGEDVADLAVQGRPRSRPVEGPQGLAHAGATSTTVSRTVMVSRCSAAPGAGCRAGLYGFQPGPGEAWKSIAGEASPAGAAFDMAPISGPDPGDFAAELAAVPVPARTMLRIIPAALCPGTLHQPSMSALTTPTVRVAFSPPASSAVRCPVARTRSWRMASSFVTFRTSRVPFVTSITDGVIRIPARLTATVWVPPAGTTMRESRPEPALPPVNATTRATTSMTAPRARPPSRPARSCPGPGSVSGPTCWSVVVMLTVPSCAPVARRSRKRRGSRVRQARCPPLRLASRGPIRARRRESPESGGTREGAPRARRTTGETEAGPEGRQAR